MSTAVDSGQKRSSHSLRLSEQDETVITDHPEGLDHYLWKQFLLQKLLNRM